MLAGQFYLKGEKEEICWASHRQEDEDRCVGHSDCFEQSVSLKFSVDVQICGIADTQICGI